MRYFDVSNLTFKHIQIFLAAAKYENFSLAAESLNVTQPLVSRTISLLEQELGFPLFRRDRRRVTLTAAGQVLRSKWQRLYNFVEKSIENAYSVYKESRATLTISDDWISSKSKYLLPITTRFRALYPEVELHVDQMSPEDTVNTVISGLSDVGFLMEPELIRLKGTNTEWRTLVESPFCADLSPTSPLYSRETLCLQDFEGIPITLMSNSIGSIYTKTIMDLFLRAGVTPQVNSYVASNSSLNFARFSGSGGAVIINDMVPLMEGTRRIPIAGTKTSLAIFWLRDNRSAYLKAFVDTALETLKHMPRSFPIEESAAE